MKKLILILIYMQNTSADKNEEYSTGAHSVQIRAHRRAECSQQITLIIVKKDYRLQIIAVFSQKYTLPLLLLFFIDMINFLLL